MTGWVHYTPEAERQLNQIDEWITQVSSCETARRFVSALLSHCEES